MRTDKGLLKIRATDTHQDKLGHNQLPEQLRRQELN